MITCMSPDRAEVAVATAVREPTPSSVVMMGMESSTPLQAAGARLSTWRAQLALSSSVPSSDAQTKNLVLDAQASLALARQTLPDHSTRTCTETR